MDPLRGFAAKHGGASAVVEYLGRRGARIVLVGDDGTWGDQVVPEGVDAAKAAVEAAGVTLVDGWPRELVEKMR